MFELVTLCQGSSETSQSVCQIWSLLWMCQCPLCALHTIFCLTLIRLCDKKLKLKQKTNPCGRESVVEILIEMDILVSSNTWNSINLSTLFLNQSPILFHQPYMFNFLYKRQQRQHIRSVNISHHYYSYFYCYLYNYCYYFTLLKRSTLNL